MTSERVIFVFTYKLLKTMNYIQIPDYVVENLIKTLEQSVEVCYNVDSNSDDCEKSPYYANGYSRAAMQTVIADLNVWKSAGELK